MPETDDEMTECIRLCWECRTECLETLFIYCARMGGDHMERRHVNVMEDCIEICQVAADFMTRVSPLHVEVCKACSEICEACADSCEKFDDEEMDHCAMTCRRCADACARLAGDEEEED